VQDQIKAGTRLRAWNINRRDSVRLPKFQYVEPKSIGEASGYLAETPSAKLLAGGTDLVVNMKHRVETPPLVINLKHIQGLDFIREEKDGLRIGPLTRLKRISQENLINEKAAVLAKAASSVGSHHHQTMGTLGGNICQQNRCKFFNQSHWWRSSRPLCYKAGGEMCYVVNKKEICFSSYCGDVAPALLALDARIVLQSNHGSRTIPLESFYTGVGKGPLDMKTGEIVAEIMIPAESLTGFSMYLKVANRESIDFPIVGGALWNSREAGEYRVAFTAVDKKPVRAHTAEKFLKGKKLTEEVISDAAGYANKEATPVKSSLYSPSYKRSAMRALLDSMLSQAMRRAQI
jgi:4-hydroxybenzoyl-CoA reductase subunit beta